MFKPGLFGVLALLVACAPATQSRVGPGSASTGPVATSGLVIANFTGPWGPTVAERLITELEDRGFRVYDARSIAASEAADMIVNGSADGDDDGTLFDATVRVVARAGGQTVRTYRYDGNVFAFRPSRPGPRTYARDVAGLIARDFRQAR